MLSKSAIMLVAALSTFALALPTLSHAENQSEWLHRQLQITDGYAPQAVLPAQDGDRAAASPIRRSAIRAPHPEKKPASRPRRVIQQPVTAHKVPVCQEACAGGERAPVQVEWAEYRVVESTREVDRHGEGMGLAAVGVLLVVAGFKVMKMVGAI